MNAKLIYKIANEMTDKQLSEILSEWESKKETKKLKDYNCLVRLGDSQKLACATVISEHANFDKEVYEFYRFAYEN